MDAIPTNGVQHGLAPKRSFNPQDQFNRQVVSPSTAAASESRTVRYAPSQHNGVQQPPIASSQVISLFEEALSTAKEAAKRSGALVESENGEMRAGVTIELSRKNIQRIPEEAIDLIKDDIERLALNFNQIMTLPPKFSDCVSLRYLNLKGNLLQEFPKAVCDLKALEILDIRSNRLKQLPPEIGNLTSLKVLSIQSNRIEKLPLCLGEMSILQCVKLAENPLVFPPQEFLVYSAPNHPSDPTSQVEADALFTGRLKEFLRSYAAIEKSGPESGDSSNGSPQPIETVRPLKRAVSGRFPVKVSNTTGSDPTSDLKSPALPRLPSSASSSHYRGLSQHTAAARRPPVVSAASVISNERNRSNSESILQATRHKRMGMVTRKTSDLGTVDEAKSRRLSHFRGVSHSSAAQKRMSSSPASHRTGSSTDSASTTGSRGRNEALPHRLSILTEQSAETEKSDLVLRATQGLVYAFYQLEPHLGPVFYAIDGAPKERKMLDQALRIASNNLESLEKQLHKCTLNNTRESEYETLLAEDSLLRDAFTTTALFYNLIGLLRDHIPRLVSNADIRQMRTLLHNCHGCAVEIRGAIQVLSEASGKDMTETLKKQADANDTEVARMAAAKTKESRKHRQHHSTSSSVSTTATIAEDDLPGNTLQMTLSGGSGYTTSSTRTVAIGNLEIDEENFQFNRIYTKLTKAVAICMDALPAAELWFSKVIEFCEKKPTKPETMSLWRRLHAKCKVSVGITQSLDQILKSGDWKEAAFRTDRDFWQLCGSFVKAYIDMALTVKDAKNDHLIPNSLLEALRPVQKSVKAVGQTMELSPWKTLGLAQPAPTSPSKQPPITHAMIQAGLAQSSNIAPPSIPSASSSTRSPSSAHTPSSSSASAGAAVPATPLSAALGPAAQATIPSSAPLSRSNTTFSGSVFERADSLLSSQSRVAIPPHSDNLSGPQTSRYHSRSRDANHG